MTKLIKDLILEKFNNTSVDALWILDHSSYVAAFAIKAANKSQILKDDIFLKSFSIAGCMIHSGMIKSDNSYYLPDSIELVEDLFLGKVGYSEIVSGAVDLMVDFWRGLDGYTMKKKESSFLLGAEIYTRIYTNFLLNAYDALDFADFKEFRGWSKDHLKVASINHFSNNLQIPKYLLNDLRSLFDRSRNIEQVSKGLESVVSKYNRSHNNSFIQNVKPEIILF